MADKWLFNLVGFVLIFGSGAIGMARAADEPSFKGKRIEAIIVSASGGGTDQSTRLVGRFMQKHLPGNPDIIYRNIPTGQGVGGLNYFAKQVKADGLTWVGGGEPHVSSITLAKEAVEYNPTTFEYFGGVSRGGSIIVMRKDKEQNLKDRALPPVIVGEIDGNRSWGQLIMWGADILGWNVRFVVGYPGTGPLALAAMRGEIDMFGTSGLNELNQILTRGFITLAQDGAAMGGKFLPRKDFPQVPVFETMTEGKLTGIAKETFEFWLSRFQMDKFYALPAGTPPQFVLAYREAYVRLFKDPEFQKTATLQFGGDFNMVTGAEVAKLVVRGAYPPKEITAYLESLKVKYGLPVQPLHDDEIAKLAKERGLVAEAKPIVAVLKAIIGGGRQVVVLDNEIEQTIEVSSSRTAIVVAGQKAGRDALKAGMNCEIAYSGADAEAITCK